MSFNRLFPRVLLSVTQQPDILLGHACLRIKSFRVMCTHAKHKKGGGGGGRVSHLKSILKFQKKAEIGKCTLQG